MRSRWRDAKDAERGTCMNVPSALPAMRDTKDAAPFRGASFVSSQAADVKSKIRDFVLVDQKNHV